jgi:hypothetical protein
MTNKRLSIIVGLVTFATLGALALPLAKSNPSPELKTRINQISVEGVCPPFFLYDEERNVIDPVHDINADKPYSPKQTCGKCHDYNKTTEGFHFQQGRGEKPDPLTAERCLWVTSPGNYGGNW